MSSQESEVRIRQRPLHALSTSGLRAGGETVAPDSLRMCPTELQSPHHGHPLARSRPQYSLDLAPIPASMTCRL